MAMTIASGLDDEVVDQEAMWRSSKVRDATETDDGGGFTNQEQIPGRSRFFLHHLVIVRTRYSD
jgi:hypothetical protein